MIRKNVIHRRKFLLQVGALGSAGSGLLPQASAAPAPDPSQQKIKLWALPNTLPFLLEETFGPGDAKGTDVDKWLTVLRFAVVKHVDADGKDVLVDDAISDRFEGEVSITASVHEASSVKDFTEDRWNELNPGDDRKNIWTQRSNDRDGNQKIYVYDPKPLRASQPIGFKWIVKVNDEGQVAVNYSDIVKVAQELPISKNPQKNAAGFQLGLALDPSPESESDIGLSVNAHAVGYAAWTPTPKVRAVDISYAGKTPNLQQKKASLPTVGMGSNRGGIGIGYMIARPGKK